MILKFNDATFVKVKDGLKRSIIYGDNLMTAVLEFSDGPWETPDPFHSHINEQSSYVAEGEILFFYEDEPPQHLKKGDVFFVPSGKNHAIQLLTEKARLIDNFTPLREDFL